jgi:4-hydroxybenzoate polyprenyltransferase
MHFRSRARAWSRFTRAHTAILEAPLPVVGYVLATGELFTIQILPWLVFGMLYHYVGYGMNSYTDWKNGFDKDDPEKQHHPLNTGQITETQAKVFTYGGLVFLGLISIIVTNFSPTAIVILAVMVISGSIYNYYGKVTVLKPLPISTAHTLVFVLPYVYLSDNLGVVFYVMVGAYFIHHYFQIGVSGDIKDIREDEANVVKYLGSELKETEYGDIILDTGRTVQVAAYTLSALQITLVLIAMLLLNTNFYGVTLMVGFSIWMMYEADATMRPGLYGRDSRIQHMSRKEIAGYMMCHVSVYSVVGPEGTALIFAFMLAYLFSVSKFTWGNWLKPDV